MRQVILGIVIGTLAGSLVTYLVSRPSEAVVPAPDGPDAVEEIPKQEAAPPEGAVDSAAEIDAKACETTLAFIRASYDDAVQEKEQNEELVAFLEELVEKSGAGSPSGNPMEFPDGLDPVYTPDGFEDALDKLKDECGDYFPPESTANCSEFPCSIVMATDKHPASGQLRENCPLYAELFGTSGSARAFSLGEDTYATQFMPRPDGQGVDDFMREYQGNLSKRAKHRFREFTGEYAREQFEAPCQAGDGAACRELGRALRDDPAASERYLGRACELGDPRACNSLAWQRCHDHGNCDDESLQLARAAADGDPDSGAIWDTLAYVLCARGDVRAADEAYAKACANGHEADCGKECAP